MLLLLELSCRVLRGLGLRSEGKAGYGVRTGREKLWERANPSNSSPTFPMLKCVAVYVSCRIDSAVASIYLLMFVSFSSSSLQLVLPSSSALVI